MRAQVNKSTLGLLKRVEPYVAFGYPNLKSVRELIYKRGFAKVRDVQRARKSSDGRTAWSAVSSVSAQLSRPACACLLQINNNRIPLTDNKLIEEVREPVMCTVHRPDAAVRRSTFSLQTHGQADCERVARALRPRVHRHSRITAFS